MKSMSYMTRAMRAKDRRYVKILGKLGYGAAEGTAPVARNLPDIHQVRADYERVVGKRPFNGWNAEQLFEKIAAARSKG
jgi:hypothetical protein